MTEAESGGAISVSVGRSCDSGETWLRGAWNGLPEIHRAIVRSRSEGETLAKIGQKLGCTRERVRQIQQRVTEELIGAQEYYAPHLPNRILEGVYGASAVTEEDLETITGLEQTLPRDVLFYGLGLEHPASKFAIPKTLWTFDRGMLGSQLQDLISAAPFMNDDAEAAAETLGIPLVVDWKAILSTPGGPLEQTEFGWVRRSRRPRDLAYLWLCIESEPRSAFDIAEAIGSTSERALREMMRRESQFVQLRPEGTWALADWHHLDTQHRYSSALEVVVEVLRDIGPMAIDRLEQEAKLRYPVTKWRIRQCLLSNLIGLNEHGLVDLVERGASPIVEPEPRRPDHIQVQGNVIGMSIQVDRNLLRGSGLPVNRWLSWYLGLRSAPSSRYFELPEPFGEVVIRRGLGMSQISSLRQVANALDVSDGCLLTLLMHTDTDFADVVHSCPAKCQNTGLASRLSELATSTTA